MTNNIAQYLRNESELSPSLISSSTSTCVYKFLSIHSNCDEIIDCDLDIDSGMIAILSYSLDCGRLDVGVRY
ncbi:hypothetical protein DERP_008794 [Dermatophagoides pteronyssinus]|uniref:Uncharacterized protein n=1 Tax=Dermatophagoides pteronyssinus TaxID=6956 RepID=A0ABQ8IWD1_DERPT|nr:hypothetical protein DERP_008794 [Dermatophagoides pteronyssinus]